jgi:hypothetical protein
VAKSDKTDLHRHLASFDHLDIFGIYFILDTEAQGQKYSVLTAEQAGAQLRISDTESLRNLQSQYLINVRFLYNFFINLHAEC